jgi:hypothetical protein
MFPSSLWWPRPESPSTGASPDDRSRRCAISSPPHRRPAPLVIPCPLCHVWRAPHCLLMLTPLVPLRPPPVSRRRARHHTSRGRGDRTGVRTCHAMRRRAAQARLAAGPSQQAVASGRFRPRCCSFFFSKFRFPIWILGNSISL